MGLIGKNNVKNASTSLIEYYLSNGYDDYRQWTGIKGESRLSIPISEFSGRDPKHRKELHIGDTLFYREPDFSRYLDIMIVDIRYLEINTEGVDWCIDYVFKEKYKHIYSARSQDLYVYKI